MCFEREGEIALDIAKTLFPMGQDEMDGRYTGSMYSTRGGDPWLDEYDFAEVVRVQRIELWRCIEGTEPAVTGYDFGG